MTTKKSQSVRQSKNISQESNQFSLLKEQTITNFTIWWVSEDIQLMLLWARNWMNTLESSMKDGFQKFNTDWTLTFITSSSKSDLFLSWLILTWKLITMEVVEMQHFCKSMKEFSTREWRDNTQKAGAKSLISIPTEFSEKQMSMSFPNLPIWGSTKSKLLTPFFTKAEEESD